MKMLMNEVTRIKSTAVSSLYIELLSVRDHWLPCRDCKENNFFFFNFKGSLVFIYFLNFQDMFKSNLMCSSLSSNPPGYILWLFLKNRSYEILSGLISPNLRSCSIKKMLCFLFAFFVVVVFVLFFLFLK